MLLNKNKKQELTLTLKEAKELYKTADKTFKQFLESNFNKKDLSNEICELVSNLKDVFELLGENMDEYLLFDLDTKNKRERYLNACSLIPKIVECYNEREKLNFENTNIYKYCPYRYFSSGSWLVHEAFYWCTYFHCPLAFYYKSSKLSFDGYNKFKEIYNDYWTYLEQ